MIPAHVETLSRGIQEAFLALREFREAWVVHSYVGIKANEVRTDRILLETLRSGRRLVVPRVSGDRLEHHEIHSLADLRAAPFGLLEPDPMAPTIEVEEIDLVAVPGVAFDRAGNRLGLGKGYYDRFLSGSRAVKAALLYSCQLVDEVPVARHDVPMDLLITEDAVEPATARAR